MDQGGLAFALAVVFLANLAPAFMPPTWAILAVFVARAGMPLVPLALGGAVAAASGRTVLALASRRWGTRLLPRRRRDDLAGLGRWVEERARWAPAAAMLLYSFGPIPSNQLFMAAGITRLRLAPIVGAFFAGRVLSYTFWVSTAMAVTGRLEDVFSREWRDGAAIALDLLLLAALVALALVDPRDVLRRLRRAGPAVTR